MINSPFLLKNTSAYQKWRLHKLALYPIAIDDLFVNIANPSLVTDDEIASLSKRVQDYNLAFYRFMQEDFRDKSLVHSLGNKLGLKQLDSNLCAGSDNLTSIEVRENKNQHGYIPYTNRRLSWHTDGYYNTLDKQVRGILLHCAQPAVRGGENMLLDIEIAYILLRDENPDYIKALMQDDAMTIPANILNGKVIREAQTGPVFSISTEGHLHMRYSARKRNIEWKNDENLLEAKDFLQNIWEEGSPYILQYKLKAGEGIVCNNALHSRTTFVDSTEEKKKRLLYRGRYYDRMKDLITGHNGLAEYSKNTIAKG